MELDQLLDTSQIELLVSDVPASLDSDVSSDEEDANVIDEYLQIKLAR